MAVSNQLTIQNQLGVSLKLVPEILPCWTELDNELHVFLNPHLQNGMHFV